jgi:hypothetical protein
MLDLLRDHTDYLGLYFFNRPLWVGNRMEQLPLATLDPERRAALWQVAQSLLDVLPDNDAEQKALAVLLSGKERTERAADEVAARPQAVQGRLFE